MDHYYSAKPTSESNRETWHTTINGKDFTYTTDAGVFSKNAVDQGSEVLMVTGAEQTYPKGNILDLGCGYGPVGVYLGQAFLDRTIEMVDINERALELSKVNAEQNGVKNVEVYQSNIYENIENKQFAAILSNPPIRAGKKVVHEILEKAHSHLVEGGRLLIVIQKKQGAPSAKKKMEDVFGNVERINLDKGYWILASTKQFSPESTNN